MSNPIIEGIRKVLFGKKAQNTQGQQPVQYTQSQGVQMQPVPPMQPSTQAVIQPQPGQVIQPQPDQVIQPQPGQVIQPPEGTPVITQVTQDMQLAQAQANEQIGIRDILAPSYIEVDFNYIQVGRKYFRTLFISKYPRVVRINWLSPLINFDSSLIISTHYYPLDIKDVLARLKKKMGELEATLMVQVEKGKVIDPTAKVALKDAQSLQDAIASGAEKLFQFGLYVTVEANSTEELNKVTKDVVSTISALDMQADPTTLQMEQGLQSSIPSGVDKLFYNRNLDTTSIATTFPFITSELTMDHGILYGVNLHNKSLVVFDRFDLENANSTVFARSGAGKSYFVKLEIFRSLMLGTEVIIIDPEKEYESLAKSLDGLYITFSQDEGYKVNPFELPGALIEEGVDQLREKILSLQRFFNIMFGGTSNLEKAILDRAMMLTYNEKGITVEPSTQSNPAPLLEDLYKVLKGFTEEDAQSLAKRMERFIIGSAAGIFNERTNLSLDNPFTVFSIRDLSEELRPLAMYQMLDFIWTNIRKIRKKRILVVEEAWYMMQRPDSAEFMYSIAKRARKYYLGLTTISQDVDDFLSTDYGKAVVNNSAMQILLKQSSSAIDRIQFVFKLTEGERSFLLRCGIGEGLFFAGNNHVAIKSVSSLAEHRLMTTNPQEMDFYKQVGLMDDTDSEKLSKVFTPTLVESLYGNKNGNI